MIFSRLGGYQEKIAKCIKRIPSHEVSDNLENGAHLDCLTAFKDEMTKLILSLYQIQLQSILGTQSADKALINQAAASLVSSREWIGMLEMADLVPCDLTEEKQNID